jgi:predicted flap endonuclease-1-like 5' DNA nuclease
MDNYLQFTLIGLIFGIVGYFIGKISTSSFDGNKDENWKFDLENCIQKNSKLQAEIDKLKQNTLAKTVNFTEKVNESNSNITFDAAAAKAVYGKSYKQDDLKIIEGIGPKIEELFKTSGILTWKALSETSVDRLREILSKAGERYHIHDPSTWPRQAKLAYEGKWQKLKDWQNNLEGGREV